MKSYLVILAAPLMLAACSNAQKTEAPATLETGQAAATSDATKAAETTAATVPNLGGKCDEEQTYDIAFDRFDETAQQIAHASGCFIKTDLSKTGAIKPHPVKGKMTIREAVAMAIKGTSLTIADNQPDEITVK